MKFTMHAVGHHLKF